MEFSIYAFIVAIWNRAMMRRPRQEKPDFRPFFEFLFGVYEGLEPARAVVPADAWSGIWERWRKFAVEGLNPLSLKADKTAAAASWNQWLRSIQKVVVEAYQNTWFHVISQEESPEGHAPSVHVAQTAGMP